MRNIIAGGLIYAIWLLSILQVSCLKDDRCGEGYNYKEGVCYKGAAKTPAADASTSNKDAATGQEAGDDDGAAPATPTGLGETCSEQAQCAGKEANYCMLNPATGEGYCTIKGCTNTAGSCPDDFLCCALPEPYGAVCVDAEGYQSAKSMGFCGT